MVVLKASFLVVLGRPPLPLPAAGGQPFGIHDLGILPPPPPLLLLLLPAAELKREPTVTTGFPMLGFIAANIDEDDAAALTMGVVLVAVPPNPLFINIVGGTALDAAGSFDFIMGPLVLAMPVNVAARDDDGGFAPNTTAEAAVGNMGLLPGRCC